MLSTQKGMNVILYKNAHKYLKNGNLTKAEAELNTPTGYQNGCSASFQITYNNRIYKNNERSN